MKSEGHSGSEAEYSNHVFIGVQRRIEQELHVRGDGYFFGDLYAVEQFGGILVVEIRTENGLVGLAPVNSYTQQISRYRPYRIGLITNSRTDRIFKQTATVFGKARPHKRHPFVTVIMRPRQCRSPAILDASRITFIHLPQGQMDIVKKGTVPGSCSADLNMLEVFVIVGERIKALKRIRRIGIRVFQTANDIDFVTEPAANGGPQRRVFGQTDRS